MRYLEKKKNVMYNNLRYGGNYICYKVKKLFYSSHGPKVPIVEETPF